MDHQAHQTIVRSHAHLISKSSSSTPAILQNTSKPSMKTETSTTDESGPPSPAPASPGPIINFAEVEPGIYRSSFPLDSNIDHLRSLGLKTILSLVPHSYHGERAALVEQSGIRHICVPISALKVPEDFIARESIVDAMRVLLDPGMRPVLVHCNKGKHRTGTIIALLRRLNHWSLAAALAEYRHYAGSKSRALDERFITNFDVETIGAEALPKQPPTSIKRDSECLDVRGERKDMGMGMGMGLGMENVRVPWPTPPGSDKDGGW